MPLFDPATIDRQIAAITSTIPPGSKVALIGHYDHKSRTFSLSVAGKVGDHVQVYGRVAKPLDHSLEGDAGIKVHFLVSGNDLTLTRWQLFKYLFRRFGWKAALLSVVNDDWFELEFSK